MDRGISDHSFDSDIDIEAIDFTESLASRSAFENYLFDHKAQRRASHTMDAEGFEDVEGYEPRPIVVSKDLIETKIPEEVRDVFGDSDRTIEHLKMHLEESPYLAFFYMSFTMDDVPHSITAQSDEDYSTYKTKNAYGETVEYRFEASAAQALLAAFLYAREFSDLKPLDATQRAAIQEGQGETWLAPGEMFSLEDSAISSKRIGNSDLIERMIMTFGHFDGVSQTVTNGLLPAGNQILFAELSHTESAQYTHASNDLDLAVFDSPTGDIEFERMSLAQHIAEINAFKGENFNDQIGEIALGDQLRTITPQIDLKAWSALCTQFYKTIQPELEPYDMLDDPV